MALADVRVTMQRRRVKRRPNARIEQRQDLITVTHGISCHGSTVAVFGALEDEA